MLSALCPGVRGLFSSQGFPSFFQETQTQSSGSPSRALALVSHVTHLLPSRALTAFPEASTLSCISLS